VLSDRTVGRESDLEILLARLISAAQSRNRAHSLLIGPRGAGKTHLLNVAMHRARQHPDVERRLVFVRFDEDAIGIHRYDDILAEVMATLTPSSGARRRPKLSSSSERDVAEALGPDRVLVLAMENLDRIFHGLGVGGQQDFRGWVETSGQVMVLATSPALFKGVRDRALPWWGNFGIHNLDELSLEEGRELLSALAQDSGDDELAEFLTTPKAEGRLRAINALAGGSPRVWMILSECLTVATLDELAPAVEALLEGLVPYYQQLLWDLSPVEQRLVRELADGPHHAATVQELAAACDIDQRVAASTLKRLSDMRWVKADKSPELDQRLSWYRLREPLVRHHFQYRSASDQPLPLIVELLKAWYDPAERREHLLRVSPGSYAERLVAATLGDPDDVAAFEYLARDVAALQADARSWLHSSGGRTRTPEAGALIDILVSAAKAGPDAAIVVVGQRSLTESAKTTAVAAAKRAIELAADIPVEERFAELLRFAAAECRGDRTGVILELVSAVWDAPAEPRTSMQRLGSLFSDAALSSDDLLFLEIWMARLALTIALPSESMTAYADALVDHLAEADPEVGILLVARFAVATFLIGSRRYADARDRLVALVPDLAQQYGDEHALTQQAQIDLAGCAGVTGDPSRSMAQLAEFAQTTAKGDSTRARMWLAACTAQCGEPGKAIEQAWLILAEEVLEEDVIDFLEYLVRTSFVQLMESPSTHPNWREGGLIPTVQAAAAGEEEALMRLPAELADIVRTARARSAQPAEATP
jgi:hypothetical protein